MEGIKFPGEIPNGTPATDDRILFSDTSDGGNTKDCSVDELIGGKANLTGGNTFSGEQKTNQSFRGLYLLTEDQLCRVSDTDNAQLTVNYSSVKNDGSFGNTQYRSFAVYNGRYSEIFRLDGLTRDMSWNGQNWTSAWTSYTPALINSTGATMSLLNARYKVVGKTCFLSVRLIITGKGTSSGDFGVSLPLQVYYEQTINGGIFPIGTKDSRGFANVSTSNGGRIQFTTGSQSANLSWSGVSVNDEVAVSGSFELA